MFWSTFIFRGHSAREPVSIVCDNEQVYLFYSADRHKKLALATANTEKIGRGFRGEKMKVNGPGR